MARKVKRKATKRKTAARKSTTKRKVTKKRVAARKTTKRTAKSKTTARKAKTAKKVVARKTLKKLEKSPLKKAYNKSQVLSYIADATELSKKEISNVLECLDNLMQRHLCNNGAREFTIPGLMKCTVKRKPATKARKGVNPFTGEECMFKAKPARNIVKIRPLKKLKEMAK